MTTAAATHRPGWLLQEWVAHAASAVALAAMLVLLWPPASAPAAVPASQARGIDELAALLGGAPDPEAVERNLREWTRFFPSGADGQQLATSVAGCPMMSLPESTRVELARRLYVITNGSDVSDAELARTQDLFQRAAARAGCRPDATLTLLETLRRTARHDPHPRADWW